MDKPLLDVGSTSILARIIAALDIADIAISANGDPARFAGFGLPVLPDAFVGQGPLAGVLAGLEWGASIGVFDVLTVPGDTPFAPMGLITALAPAPACAMSLGRVHHLVALWPVDARVALRALLAGLGPRSVAAFGERMGMRRVDFPVGAWDPFLNVNAPEDLAAARDLARSEAGARDLVKSEAGARDLVRSEAGARDLARSGDGTRDLLRNDKGAG